MMKKLLAITIVSVLSLFLVSGNTMAYPAAGDVLSGHTGFTWVDAPYWTITDFTTGQQGSTYNIIFQEAADYESDFGIFSKDDPTNMFQIFGANKEPFDAKSVYFRNNSGTWQVTLNALDDTSWVDFDVHFGFYYGVHKGGVSGPVDYTFYTDASMNTADVGIQHIGMEWDGIENAWFYVEDLLADVADWDWNDMTVNVHDVEPIPEPTTLLLLGAGLIGLLGLGRKLKK